VTQPSNQASSFVESLLDEAVYRLPQRRPVDTPSWLGHVPFAFWLVPHLAPRVIVELGTHRGVSYFAFCEALAAAGIEARAFAIDHWRGDPHSSEYAGEVFEEVQTWNQMRYGHFSTLIRSTFDEAAPYFADDSIDLLHIDGYHTYEAAKHDVDTWLPKVSRRGVFLLHDIAEHRDDFGVWRLWSELRGDFPTFELHHSHGLGVVMAGDEIPERVLALANAEVQPVARRHFSALGERVSQLAIDVDRERSLRRMAEALADDLRLDLAALRASAATVATTNVRARRPRKQTRR
jgi:O-antigen biosynthesis protein